MASRPTVPKPGDDDVQRWLALCAPGGAAVCVPYEDNGYAARYCHVSTKFHAMTHGGHRVHGWALWRWAVPSAPAGTTMIIAEHHSLWETPAGTLVDLTPPPSGTSSVLFVRDDNVPIRGANGVFQMWADRTNWPEVPRMLAGNSHDQDNWSLDAKTKHDLRVYANKLGFDLAHMATEPDYG